MQVALSELKVNVGKYVDMSEREDIYITRNGKQVAKLVGTNRDRATEVRALFGIAKGVLPKEYDDPNYDPYYKAMSETLREERYGI